MIRAVAALVILISCSVVAIADTPEETAAKLNNDGIKAFREQKSDEAEKDYQQALLNLNGIEHTEKLRASILTNMALIYDQRGEKEKAAQTRAEADQLTGNDVKVKPFVSSGDRFAGKRPAALEMPTSLAGGGGLPLPSGNFDDKSMRTIIEMMANNATGTVTPADQWCFKGYVALRKKEESEAKRCFDQSISLSNKNFNALAGRAALAVKSKDTVSGIKDISAAIALHPCAAFYYIRSILYVMHHEFANSISDGYNCIKFDKGKLYPDSYLIVAASCVQLGKCKDGMPYVQRYIGKCPLQPFAYVVRAAIEAQTGSDEAARADIQKARDLGFDFSKLGVPN